MAPKKGATPRRGPSLAPDGPIPLRANTPGSNRSASPTRRSARKSQVVDASVAARASSAFGGTKRNDLSEESTTARRRLTLAGLVQEQQDQHEIEVSTASNAPQRKAPIRKRAGTRVVSEDPSEESLAEQDHRKSARAPPRSSDKNPNGDLGTIDEDSSLPLATGADQHAAPRRGQPDSGRLSHLFSGTLAEDTTAIIDDGRSYPSQTRLIKSAKLTSIPRPYHVSSPGYAEKLRSILEAAARQTSGVISRHWPLLRIILPLLSLLTFVLLALTSGLVSTPASIAYDTTSSFIHGIRSHILQLPQLPLTKIRELGSRNSTNANLLKRVTTLQEELRSLAKKGELHESTLTHISDSLPEVMSTYKRGGEWELPDRFWAAFKARSEAEGTNVPQWHDFLNANKAEVEAYLDSRVHHGLYEKRLASKEEVLEMIQHVYSSQQSDAEREYEKIDDKISALTRVVGDKASQTAGDYMKKALSQLPVAQLNALAVATLAKNTELALKEVNYFSPNLGAAVDPYLTSPTQTKQRSFVQRVYLRLVGWREINPRNALEPWTEPGQCWCAAHPQARPNEKTEGGEGKAQVAVLLPRSIVPTSVTIEHMPRSGVLDKLSAPREIEVFAAIDDPIAWDKASALSRRQYGHREPSLTIERRGLPSSYVQIADFTYDWEGPNHVQNFRTNVDLWEERLTTRKIIVRAKSNYGGAHTCFYRIRMHGEMHSEN